VLHVLVVDDDAVIRQLVGDVLEMEGHEVSAAPDGLAAMHLLEQRRPDCVLLDVMMPGMDGISVLGNIRSTRGLGDLPVVLLTAAADDTTTWRGWSAGADYILAKPIDIEALLAFLGSLRPGRRRSPAPAASPYGLVLPFATVGRTDPASASLVLRSLQDSALLAGGRTLLLTNLTDPLDAEPSRTAGLRLLAASGADVVVLGARLPRRERRPGEPVLVPLRPDDRMADELVQVVCGSHCQSVLAARPGERHPGLDVLLSDDPEVVATVADAMLLRVPHLGLTRASPAWA